MAIDNTPPRLKLIVTIAAITLVTLVSVDFALRSYYAFMTDQAQREKLAPPKELMAQRAQEEAALKTAQIDQAMSQIAKGVRAEIIAPKQSDDLTPMTGWSQAPKPAPTPHPTTAAAPAPAPATDAATAPAAPEKPATAPAAPEKKPATPPAPEKKPATPPAPGPAPAPAPGGGAN